MLNIKNAVFAFILAIFLLALWSVDRAVDASPFTPVHSAAKAFECKETTESFVTGTLENLPAAYVKEEITGWQLVKFMQAFNAQEPRTNIKADRLVIIGAFVLGPNWIGVFSIAGCLVDKYIIEYADLEKLRLGMGQPA